MSAPASEGRRDRTPSDILQTPTFWEGQQEQVGVTEAEVELVQAFLGVEEALLAQE